jgi:protein-tyrosine-phosphatase
MSEHVYNVLFLCTGNSARSIMAEAMLNKLGEGRFRAFSAGSTPTGEINPIALRLLKELDFPMEGIRSKNWDEFAVPSAPKLDFVFTLCDNAAGETCPAWPGQPMTAHWGIEDPATVKGSEIDKEKAFVTAMRYLRNRIGVFINLPIASLDDLTLGKQLREIGRQAGASQPRPDVA